MFLIPSKGWNNIQCMQWVFVVKTLHSISICLMRGHVFHVTSLCNILCYISMLEGTHILAWRVPRISLKASKGWKNIVGWGMWFCMGNVSYIRFIMLTLHIVYIAWMGMYSKWGLTISYRIFPNLFKQNE